MAYKSQHNLVSTNFPKYNFPFTQYAPAHLVLF